MTKTKQTVRKVNRPSSSQQMNRSLSSNQPKKRVNVKNASKQLHKTKTRRYFLYGFACLVATQVVKYIVDTFIFTGSSTPGGIGFLAVFYIQVGLLLAAVGLVILGSVSYLRSLNKQI